MPGISFGYCNCSFDSIINIHTNALNPKIPENNTILTSIKLLLFAFVNLISKLFSMPNSIHVM